MRLGRHLKKLSPGMLHTGKGPSFRNLYSSPGIIYLFLQLQEIINSQLYNDFIYLKILVLESLKNCLLATLYATIVLPEIFWAKTHFYVLSIN